MVLQGTKRLGPRVSCGWALEEMRSNRVVTFVTGRELEGLEQIAWEEDRSLSAVVHRIIAQHLKNSRPTENEEI